MGLTLVTSAIEEPVSRSQVKDHLRIHQEMKEHDLYIDDLIVAARSHCETYLRRQLLRATWKLTLEVVPGACGTPLILIPRPPLIEVDYIRYLDPDLNWQTLSEDQYEVSSEFEPGRVFPSQSAGGVWPTTANQAGAFEVQYQAGYSDQSKLPRMICVGISEMVRLLYDGVSPKDALESVETLLHQYRCLDDRVADYA